jgi:hypothetical protein
MGAGNLARGGLAGIALRWASRLRFPYLFAITALLFIVNLFVPDAIPMADELVMGLVALLLGSLRKRSKNQKGTDESSDDPENA